MLRSPLPKRSCSLGFTLLEVMIAMAILVIGISAMAALSATLVGKGRQSKYMSLAGTLASEKLEDLNRWPGLYNTSGTDISDPHVCVPGSSTPVGGLSADSSMSITNGNGYTQTINYFDDVSIDVTNNTDCPNPNDGCFAETTSSVVSGTTTYSTTYHSPDGTIPAGGASSTPVGTTTAPGNLTTFHRRWTIEPSPVVSGVTVTGMRRITVKVTLQNASLAPGFFFQMSVVRP